MKKTIVIIGASGFIGEALGRFFVNNDYNVTGFTRSLRQAKILEHMHMKPVLWDGKTITGWETELEGVDAIVNLSGENIGSGRWSIEKKNRILRSRVEVGKLLTLALEKVERKPGVFVQASAVGFYGTHDDDVSDEWACPGNGFLAEVVKQWESSTLAVEEMGIRRILCRFGVVLGEDKGALKRIALPFRFFIGGRIGSGNQWVSWVHIDDLIRGVNFLIMRRESKGAYNIVSPGAVRNSEFAKTLGKIMRRPSIFPVPGFLVKLILGEMADQLLLKGQRVIPARLIEEGYSFKYGLLEQALGDLF